MNNCPIFIGGEWQTLTDVPTTPVFNPSTGNVIAETPLSTARHVEEAAEAAAAAFPAWAETPPVERARVLFRFKVLLEQNFEELIRPTRGSTAKRWPSPAATLSAASK